MSEYTLKQSAVLGGDAAKDTSDRHRGGAKRQNIGVFQSGSEKDGVHEHITFCLNRKRVSVFKTPLPGTFVLVGLSSKSPDRPISDQICPLLSQESFKITIWFSVLSL